MLRQRSLSVLNLQRLHVRKGSRAKVADAVAADAGVGARVVMARTGKRSRLLNLPIPVNKMLMKMLPRRSVPAVAVVADAVVAGRHQLKAQQMPRENPRSRQPWRVMVSRRRRKSDHDEAVEVVADANPHLKRAVRKHQPKSLQQRRRPQR